MIDLSHPLTHSLGQPPSTSLVSLELISWGLFLPTNAGPLTRGVPGSHSPTAHGPSLNQLPRANQIEKEPHREWRDGMPLKMGPARLGNERPRVMNKQIRKGEREMQRNQRCYGFCVGLAFAGVKLGLV